MASIADSIGLSSIDIATMPLVAENLYDSTRRPLCGISLVGSLLESEKGICDLLRRVTVQIHKEGKF